MARPPIRPIAHRRRRLCGRIKNSLKFYSKRRFSSCTDATPRLNTGSQQRWPVRLSVRTPGFQPGKRGSIPLRAATDLVLNNKTLNLIDPIELGSGLSFLHKRDDRFHLGHVEKQLHDQTQKP